MDQDTAARGIPANRRPRGRYRGHLRARGGFQQANHENRNVDATNRPEGHPASAFVSQGQNDITSFHGLQRGNANLQGRARRWRDRGDGRGPTNKAGRGRGDIPRSMHTNASNMTFRQAQTPQSMPTATVTPSHNQLPAKESWLTPSPIANLSTHSISGHRRPGLFQIYQENSHPVAAEIPIGQFEKIDLTNGSDILPHGSFGVSIPLEQLLTPHDSIDSTSNAHLSYQPTNTQIIDPGATQFASQMSSGIAMSSGGPPNISAIEGIGFKTGHSSQSSPLTYLCAHSTPLGLSTLQLSNITLPGSMYSMLSSPFGSMYVSVLDGLSVPQRDLEEHGYRTRDLTKRELEDKQRCSGCGKSWSKVRKNEEYQRMMARKTKASTKTPESQQGRQILLSQSKDTSQSPGTANAEGAELKETEVPKSGEAKPILHCRFHSGALVKAYNQTPKGQTSKPGETPRYGKVWSCCNKQPSAEPCSGNEHHELREVDIKTLSAQWQLRPTPPAMSMNMASYRAAVALDCEMGVSKTGDSELIRITLIDYFTTETLIDKLVFPEVPMQHLNTQYSGVTWDMLNTAANKRKCLRGRAAALEEVWKYVGLETIVVAHSGHNDLSSLRWRHYKVVDTYLIDAIPERDRLRELKKLEDQQRATDKNKDHKHDHIKNETTEKIVLSNQKHKNDIISNEAGNPDHPKPEEKQDNSKKVKGRGPFSLKTLAKSRLGRDIQTGKRGHDSLEDALAARDLAHWHVRRIIEGIGIGEGEGNMAG